MKNLAIKIIMKVIFLIGIFTILQAQEKQTIALISIDTRNLDIENGTMANMLRLELEKIDRFEVLDKYDVSTTLEINEIDPSSCFGKNALIHAGTLLKADKIITGNAELYGDKIVLILRLVDVKGARVETTSVMEYLNAQSEIQTMGMISLNDLLKIENDPHLVDLLINYSLPITTRQTTSNLNGPRMGAVYTMGSNGDRLKASKNEGGYNMFPVSMMFGYQYEKQYMSAGDFQALVEMVVAVNGLESGTIIPSVTFLNGFRFNKSGFEFGLGPVLRLVKTEEGYYSKGEWIRTKNNPDVPENVKTENLVDNRGILRASLGMIVAVGKTFKSGYLNMPVNLYLSPIKSGSIVGLTIGFNTSKKPSFN